VSKRDRSWWWAPIGVGAVSAALVAMSLVNVHTETVEEWGGYVHVWLWQASWLLVIPIFVAARRTPARAWLTVLCAVVPQWVVLVVIRDRVHYARLHTYESPSFPYDWAADVIVAGMMIAFVVSAFAGRRFAAATRRR
jgi:L-asparagine transporter-like permease